MEGISIDVTTGKQVVTLLTDDEIAAIQAAQQSQPSPRIEEIRSRLTQIDIDSVRPLRAISAGTATQFDTDKLAALDAEAEALRQELNTLTTGQ